MKQTSVGIVLGLIALIAASFVGYRLYATLRSFPPAGNVTTTSSVRFINSTITAEGTVTAATQAKLNFQTAGKLIRLPFKEGDRVVAGQTVAQLDTYALQRQLATALNNYRSTRDTFDQTQQNSQNNVLNTQLNSTYAKSTADLNNTVNDAIKRLVDQNQASLDNSVITVELANYALQLSRLASPISGVVTHEDVTVAGVNVTPTTTFVIADPDSMVFRANVPASTIDYISIGSSVSLAIDGLPNKIAGKIIKLYPSKVMLATGQAVYQVDIASDALKQQAKLEQAGRAIISTNAENVALVPAWIVLGGQYIWIETNGTPELRQIKAGQIHGQEVEITQGLSPTDKIIIDPRYITSLKYQAL